MTIVIYDYSHILRIVNPSASISRHHGGSRSDGAPLGFRVLKKIEQIVRDTAYAFELRGARRLQAWENLKKMRGLIRRIQNRGTHASERFIRQAMKRAHRCARGDAFFSPLRRARP